MSVSRELTVESHADSNRSGTESSSEAVISVNSVDSGDPEGESVLVAGVAGVSVSVGEGVVGGGSEMSSPPDSFQSFVVESSSSDSGPTGTVSGLLFGKSGVSSVSDGSVSLQDSGSGEGPASVGVPLVLGRSESTLVVSSEVELRVDLSLLKYIIVSIHAGGVESSHVLGFSFSQISEQGDTVGDILVFFVVSGSVLYELSEVGQPQSPLTWCVFLSVLILEHVEETQHNLGISVSQVDDLVLGARHGCYSNHQDDEHIHGGVDSWKRS